MSHQRGPITKGVTSKHSTFSLLSARWPGFLLHSNVESLDVTLLVGPVESLGVTLLVGPSWTFKSSGGSPSSSTGNFAG
jgi:hypothetical protein